MKNKFILLGSTLALVFATVPAIGFAADVNPSPEINPSAEISEPVKAEPQKESTVVIKDNSDTAPKTGGIQL